MAPYTTPEILRVPLDSLLLQMVSMGLPDARKFPFVEAPPAESIEQSIKTLKEQVKIVMPANKIVMISNFNLFSEFDWSPNIKHLIYL
jgi:HrpA-like RNA helicase